MKVIGFEETDRYILLFLDNASFKLIIKKPLPISEFGEITERVEKKYPDFNYGDNIKDIDMSNLSPAFIEKIITLSKKETQGS